MTPTRDDSISGLGPRSGVPRLAPQIDWSTLDLDDVHGFVLSRIDGRTTIAEVCLLAPFPEPQTAEILRSLFARGVIDIPGVARPPAPPPRQKPVAPPPVVARQSSSDKVPATPRVLSSDKVPAVGRTVSSDKVPAVPRVGTSDKVPAVRIAERVRTPSVNPDPRSERPEPGEHAREPPSVPTREPSVPTREPSVPTREPSVPTRDPSAPSRLPTPARVVPVRPAEEPEADDLPPEVRARIDEMLALASRGDPAALLGVAADADKKEVRRAYFRLSKEFHPDRYFKRQLGAYKKKLQTVFNALTEAADKLTGGDAGG